MTSTISSGCSVTDIDDSYFEKHSDEICVTWFPHNECSYVIDNCKQTSTNSKMKMDKNVQFVLTRGNIRCEVIATGYLRQNFINPKDINTIISKYLSPRNIQISVENDHQKCLIFFPSMKRVCISISHAFEETAFRFFDSRFGVIGIPNNCNKKNNDIKTFYTLLNKYDSKLRSMYSEIDFCDIHELFGDIINTFEKGSETKDIDAYVNRDPFDMEVIDCAVSRASNSIHHSIEYCGKLTENMWDDVAETSAERNVSNQKFNDKFEFNKDDSIVLEYDKNENTFSMALYGNKENSKPEFVTMESNIFHDSPIKAKKEKLILEKGYDYVLACCLNGCDQTPAKNNTFIFSSTRQNL